MLIDDRLATVLTVRAEGESQKRVQYRQLLDLLGTSASELRGDGIDAALLRLTELAQAIPAAERARIIADPGLRLRNPRLVATIAADHPATAQAAMAAARLTDEQWLDLLPALHPRARDCLVQRPDLAGEVAERLAQLGAGAAALPQGTATLPQKPAAQAADIRPADATPPDLVALAEPLRAEPTAADVFAEPGREAIGAIVRRIEAFRRSREGAATPAAGDAPQLPLGTESTSPPVIAFSFASDAAGRICWTDHPVAGMIVGLMLPVLHDAAASDTGSTTDLGDAFRRRIPIREAQVTLDGARAVSGTWQLDGAPEFDRNGRFTGYAGKFRRPTPAPVSATPNPEADRVRQVLHELRTPVNAIQGFAEMIHQQLVGAVPHAYRALAAGVAADAAQMLAGFDEIDRLAKLDSQAMALDQGEADLAMIIAGLIHQLEAFTAPRGSGFAFTAAPIVPPTSLAHDEAERLVWRLLATLAGAARPGERLLIDLREDGSHLALVVMLPDALAVLPDPYEAAMPVGGQAVSGGLFGTGFALRLASAEARAAGGSLTLRDGRAILTLPQLTTAHPASAGIERPDLTANAQISNHVAMSASTNC